MLVSFLLSLPYRTHLLFSCLDNGCVSVSPPCVRLHRLPDILDHVGSGSPKEVTVVSYHACFCCWCGRTEKDENTHEMGRLK